VNPIPPSTADGSNPAGNPFFLKLQRLAWKPILKKTNNPVAMETDQFFTKKLYLSSKYVILFVMLTIINYFFMSSVDLLWLQKTCLNT